MYKNKCPTASPQSLKEQVRTALHHYFHTLEGEPTSQIYNLVLTQVELPLLETVMHYADNNQSKAAKWLGLSRGTLRKLLKKYKLDEN